MLESTKPRKKLDVRMVMRDNEYVGTREVAAVGLSSMAMIDNAKVRTRDFELVNRLSDDDDDRAR